METNLYYLHVPTSLRHVAHPVDFLSLADFLKDEEACKSMWDLVTANFRTRSTFLKIWPCVRYVAVHRTGGQLAGMLLVSAPHNWQIDYVVVRPDLRGKGIAVSLVHETVNQALAQSVPYITLTSRERLRPLYEGQCGFKVVGTSSTPDAIPIDSSASRHEKLETA